MSETTELSAEELRQACDPARFTFRSTEELASLEEIIGQERALRAIDFGIDIPTPGYHMYALGPGGTGKTTTVRKFLAHAAAARPIPDDWLYVHNFAEPDKPRALHLPAGVGCRLQADMDHLVDELRGEVPRAFESDEYEHQQEQLTTELQRRHQEMIQEANAFAQQQGFVIMQTPQGLMIAPMANGGMMSPEQIQQLDDDTRHRLEAGHDDVQAKLRETMRRMQQLHQEARARAGELDRQTVAYAVGHLIDDLRERYRDHAPVVRLLDDIRADILENVAAFRQIRQVEEMREEQAPFAAMLGRELPNFDKYRVNLVVNNCDTRGAPVILARNPSYQNLIGRIEYQGQLGTLVTNFTMIKGGLLHKANGGYLMLDARDVLTRPAAWEGLKRALRTQVVEIESMAEAVGVAPFATRTLDPEPIPLDVKVVLIGDPMLYYLLFFYDPDFRELFKVKVDFALHMARTVETTAQYARFIATVCREEQLPHFDPSGVARVVEHGARLVEHRDKLVTKFGDIVDLVRESAYWARKAGRALVTGADVTRAIEEKVYRSDQIQQLIKEAIAQGSLLIDTAGASVGQTNGLSVIALGDYAFGRPTRITASVHVGDEGVLNIDREIALGGKIHNKGALILAGYLGATYATEVPLALSARITFEQTYEEVEGDSASSAELYTLLSALAGFPIRQDVAVTGSVNQHGQVQAIGGVNEKIEGFFDVCRANGLTGSQGVLIPRSNVQNLMLRPDVVDAVREGRFHIYPVATIDDGIALLTGTPAGARRPDGGYPEGTVNGAVHRRLGELARKARAFFKPEERRKAA